MEVLYLQCYGIVLADDKSRTSLQFCCYQIIEVHHYHLNILWGLEWRLMVMVMEYQRRFEFPLAYL